MAAYGLVPKKIYGMNCPGTYVMSVKNKKKSTVNFWVRAEFLTARPPASGDHYTPTALMAEG